MKMKQFQLPWTRLLHLGFRCPMMTSSRRPTTCGLRSGYAFLSFSIPFTLQWLHLTVLHIQLPLTSFPPSITDCKISSHVLPLLLPNTNLETCPFPLLPPFLPRSLVQGGSILLPMIGPPSPPSVLRSGACTGRPDHRIATFWEGGADYNRPRSGAAVAYSGPSSPPHTFIVGTTSLWID